MLDGVDFSIVNKVRNHGRNHKIVIGTKCGCSDNVIWQWKGEIAWEWDRQDISGGSKSYFCRQAFSQC